MNGTNAYIQEVVGLQTTLSSSAVAGVLWSVAEAVGAAPAAPPPAAANASSIGSAGSGSCASPCGRAASLLSVLASFVAQLCEAERTAVPSAEREPRYRFLERRFDAGMTAEVRDALRSLLGAVRSVDAVAVDALRCATSRDWPSPEEATSRAAEAASGTLEVARAAEALLCADRGCEGPPDERTESKLFDCCSSLCARVKQKAQLAEALFTLGAAVCLHDTVAAEAAAATLRGGAWGPDGGSVAAALNASTPAGASAADDAVAECKARIDEVIRRYPNDPAAVQRERGVIERRLSESAVPAAAMARVLQPADALVARLLRGGQARDGLRAALATGDVAAVRVAVQHAEEVGMKDVDGTLEEAERFLDSHERVSGMLESLAAARRSGQADALLTAISDINRFIRLNGLMLERPVQTDSRGKVVPLAADDESVYLEHFNNSFWTPDCSVLYEQTCIEYSQRRDAASLAERFQGLHQLADEEFVRAVQAQDMLRDLLADADEQAFRGEQRAAVERRMDALLRARVKVHFPQGDIKALAVPQRRPFADLSQQLRNAYLDENPDVDAVHFKMYYRDTAGDRIRLTTEEDWLECLREAQTAPLMGSLGASHTLGRGGPGEVRVEMFLEFNLGGTMTAATAPRSQPTSLSQSVQPRRADGRRTSAPAQPLSAGAPPAAAVGPAHERVPGGVRFRLPADSSPPPEAPRWPSPPAAAPTPHRAVAEPAPHRAVSAADPTPHRAAAEPAPHRAVPAAAAPVAQPAPAATGPRPSRWQTPATGAVISLPEVPDASFAAEPVSAAARREVVAAPAAPPPAQPREYYPELSLDDSDDDEPRESEWDRFKRDQGQRPLGGSAGGQRYRRSGKPLDTAAPENWRPRPLQARSRSSEHVRHAVPLSQQAPRPGARPDAGLAVRGSRAL
eukprot:TRINITY_DN6006_c1_g1_i1.p1 TRINITY_DN6006_c1_g1~~TRINITY_DN6006_c1_g1_i1.p1  ORF type:complete len:913 (+),score=312.17 TRINITY_DN6006_c1_g1_i1:90-2828(+)